ncbi:MAG: hypothetical protein JSS22_16180 [Proteobacteria bacterium]|nr:hypothetical protein [Pseudomonadota bacterium]
MFQNLGNDWITRSDGISGSPMPRYGGFGEQQEHKSTKAIIGVAILIVLSILLYELRPSRATDVSAASPAITQITPATA